MSRDKQKSVLQRIRAKIDPIDSFRTRGKMILSSKIAEAMEQKGMNHANLLEALEKKNNPSQVSRWLSGDHNFTVEVLLGIQFVLGVNLINLDLEDLFEDSSKKNQIPRNSSVNFTYTPLYPREYNLFKGGKSQVDKLIDTPNASSTILTTRIEQTL